MKTFKSIADVEQLRNHLLHTTVKSLVVLVIAEYAEYVPEDDGYLVLIETVLINLDWASVGILWHIRSCRNHLYEHSMCNLREVCTCTIASRMENTNRDS